AGAAPAAGDVVSVGRAGAERQITNVAAGQLSGTSTDAVNGSQLYATNTELSNVGSVVNNISNGGGIKYFKANSTLADSQAQGLDSVAIGPNAVAKNASDVALGNGSVTDTAVATAGATINNKAVTFAGNAPTSTVSVGSVGAERTITNVAAGRLSGTSTDAVNGSQLYATNTELSNVGSVVNNISNGGGIKYFKANSTLADSQAQGLDSVAIGPNAVAKNASDVALGNGSVTDTAVATAGATINNKAVTFAGSAPTSTVSVGSVGAERTITNVAAGRLTASSTDAVNGSQLYATNNELSNVGSTVTTITNGGGIKYFRANSTGADSLAQALESVAIGPNAVANNVGDVALGAGSTTNTAIATAGATINGKAVTFAGSAPTSTVSVGAVGAERSITNVAAGRLTAGSTDAVNGSQLYATNNELSNVGTTVTTITNGGGIKYFRANSTGADSLAQALESVAIGPNAVANNVGDVALGAGSTTNTAIATAGATINGKAVTFAGNAPTSTVSVGSVGAERTITNVAAGQLSASSTDAVNGSQLYATNNELSNVGSTVTTITNGGGIKYFRANSTGADSLAQALESVAIGPNAVAKNVGDVALGSSSVTDTAVATAGATINGKAVTFAGNAPTSTVSVGSAGAERTITNVAAGQLTGTSTDAVNGSQLYATNNELSNVGSTVTTITNGGGIKYFRANSTGADSLAQALESVAIGPNAVAKNVGDVALGSGSVTDTAVATTGATINGKAVTFAGNAPTSTVSVGSAGAERTITNVAAGQLTGTSTDAVNGSQLYATNNELSNVGSTVTTITNGGGIKYFRANSTGADSLAQALESVAIGPNAVAKNVGDVALGNGSVTDTAVATTGATINGKAVTFAGNAPTSTVSVGSVGAERTITNVAAGRLSGTSTDAVNGSQLYATNAELSNVGSAVTTITNGGGIKYFRANSTGADSLAQALESVAIGPNAVAKNVGDVALGSGSVTDTAVATTGATINGKAVTFAGNAPTSTVSVGSAGAERTITNVAAGRLTASSTDAVNGSQLYATNVELSNVGTTVTTITNGGGIKYFRANSTGADSLAQALESVAIGPNAVTKNVGDVALGSGSVTDVAVATTGASINGKAVTFAGSAPTSTVSVGSVGAERTITNVAAGRLSSSSTDAVNGSQLYATNTELSNVGSVVNNISNGGGIKYFKANSTLADSQAQGLDSVAIGPNAVAKNASDVALGNGSVTDTAVATTGATINNKAVTFAGSAPTSTVSVGSVGAERTITNVAAGRLTASSTDAVNGSQLYATNTELSNVGSVVNNISNGGGIKYFKANSTLPDSQAQGLDSVAIGPNAVAKNASDVALGNGSVTDTAVATTNAVVNGTTYNFAGTAPTSTVSVGSVGAERTIINVAAGRLSSSSTDAVNGSQLYATNMELSNVGWVVNNISNGGGIKYFKANSSAADSKASGNDSVAIGPNAVANSSGGVALGAGSVANTGAGIAGYVPPSASASAKAAIDATTSTQGAVSVGDAASGIYRQINGVAAGTADSDAVNVAQLKAVSASVSTAGDKWIVGSPTSYKAPTSTGTDSTAVGSGASVTASNSVAMGTGASVTADKSVALGNGATATTANSVALGNGSTTAAAVANTGVTLQGQHYSFAGSAPVGVVSVGSAGAERQITNVAAGQLNANSTDAVNGSQLYATNQALSNIQGGGGIKYFRANSKAADSSADGAESVAIGPQAVSTGDGSVAMGNGAKSNAANSVALGAGSTADRTGMAGKKELFSNTVVNSTQGAVSVGSAGNERQITNVAGGTEATDAVNVRQLQAVKAGSVQYDTNVDGSVNQSSITLGGSGSSATAIHNVAAGVAGTDAANVDQVKQMGQEANTYTDLRSNQLRADIQTTAKDASAGTAGAMAMAGMPQASIPGKSMWTAGAAAYDGQAAVAIGVSKLADNGRWVIKFSGSANSRGKTGVSVGAGFHW
ncbi:YadA-like family protein, partial [Variovorax sp. LT1R16]|uniref:YadA-like family protein n=1 Tax=Variovorax sp. LT1R16 TaxID=3443728 RepID=UPI003F44C698